MSLLALARDLRRRRARERRQLFVAEGVRTVEELLRASMSVTGALITPRIHESSRGAALVAQLAERGIQTDELAEPDFNSAAETDSPQGILAIAAIPSAKLGGLPVAESLRLLVLDAVQDPGNAGTILRTAAAFAASATIALPGTVDLWNAKVVRSGMGAHFQHSCLTATWDDVDTFRARHAVELWAADAAGEPIAAVQRPPRVALVVGNEGAGLSSSARSRADRLVALPISAAVESLNVAVATGILLYELHR